ncbi:MAG: tRNA lysidine(34) synthetase TilS [Crocinitomicaceae bacterium]
MLSFSEHTTSIWQNLRESNVFLACSGGVDSMVLLHALHRLNINLRVIHVNYQLRGEDSELDAELVETTCRALGVPFEIRAINLKEQLENGGNLQEEARNVRYSWFDEILQENSKNRIALAHHQDDQVETFLMNLARKSGVLGLACMKYEHKGIVRPMIDFSKLEILKYAKTHKVQWRQDQSNATNNYTRNRLRNEFIPLIHSEIQGFNDSVIALIRSFQEKQIELERTVASILKSIYETGALSRSRFEALDELEQIEVLRQLGISPSYLPRLINLTERGKRLEFNHSAFESVVRDEDQFTFLKKELSSFELHLEKVDSLPKVFDKAHAYLDKSKIQGELRLRKWEIGDRIAPIGMKGSQLISDIIKDAKINADSKRNQLVMHDDANILWCVGLKISRKAIAEAHSTEILRCSIIDSRAEESEVQ